MTRQRVLAVTLSSLMLFVMGCGGSSATASLLKVIRIAVADLPCVLSTGFSLYAIFHEHETTPSELLEDGLDFGKECIPAGVDTYKIWNTNDSSGSTPTPTGTPITIHVDIEHEFDQQGQIVEHTYKAAAPTNALANCDNTNPESVNVTLSVPFKMYLASKSTDPKEQSATFDADQLQSLANETDTQLVLNFPPPTDSERIARELYRSDNIGQFVNPAGTPSVEQSATIPPRTKQAFQVNYTIFYRVGGGLVSWSTGGVGEVHEWLYPDGVLATSIQPSNPVPVTSADCP